MIVFNYEKFSSHVIRHRVTVMWLTQNEACYQLGISKGTLINIERGKFINMENFIKVCDWMELKPEIFFLNK